MKALSFALITASALLSANANANPIAGPIGTYYITDNSSGIIHAIKDHATGFTPMKDQSNKTEWPIAVVGQEVHTAGYEEYSNGLVYGSAYTGVPALNLTQTNAIYPGVILGWMTDGTSDGTHNYGITYGAAGGLDGGKVFQFNTDWNNKQLLFNLPDIPGSGGSFY